MTAQDTSLLMWIALQPSLGARQLQVLQALRDLGTASNNEIARHLDAPINSITPRVHELRGLTKNKQTGQPLIWPPRIACAGVRECEVTGRNVNVWMVVGE